MCTLQDKMYLHTSVCQKKIWTRPKESQRSLRAGSCLLWLRSTLWISKRQAKGSLGSRVHCSEAGVSPRRYPSTVENVFDFPSLLPVLLPSRGQFPVSESDVLFFVCHYLSAKPNTIMSLGNAQMNRFAWRRLFYFVCVFVNYCVVSLFLYLFYCAEAGVNRRIGAWFRDIAAAGVIKESDFHIPRQAEPRK